VQNCACRPINRLQKASSGEQALGPGGIVTVLCQLDVSFTSDYCQKGHHFIDAAASRVGIARILTAVSSYTKEAEIRLQPVT